MAYEDEQSRQSSFNQPNAVNTVTIVDEPEENTVIYSWRDGQLKKLPYQENNTQTGQKIKTFLSFNSEEKVIVVNINKEQMCLSVVGGTVGNNQLKRSGEPFRYYSGKENINNLGKECIHKIPVDNPVLIFSLEASNFGDEIKGKIVRDSDVPHKEYIIPFGECVFVGVNIHKSGEEIIGLYQAEIKE